MVSSSISVLVFLCYICSSQAYQGPQGLSGKVGRSGMKASLRQVCEGILKIQVIIS